MSQLHSSDKTNTIEQLKNAKPVNVNKTWLRHKADGESGLIDLMVLEGCFSIQKMAIELSKNPALKAKSINQWEKRIKDHILHLSSTEGDSRNRASGVGGHNLRVKETSSGAIAFDY